METIVIHPENEPPFSATEYLLSTEANKEWLNIAMDEAKSGEGIEIKLENLWK